MNNIDPLPQTGHHAGPDMFCWVEADARKIWHLGFFFAKDLPAPPPQETSDPDSKSGYDHRSVQENINVVPEHSALSPSVEHPEDQNRSEIDQNNGLNPKDSDTYCSNNPPEKHFLHMLYDGLVSNAENGRPNEKILIKRDELVLYYLNRLLNYIASRYASKEYADGTKKLGHPLYSYLFGNAQFTESGEYTGNPSEGEGLTCATFVLAVFEANGLVNIDKTSWIPRSDDQAIFDNYLHYLRQRGGFEDIAQAMEKQKDTMPRFRPDEIAACCREPRTSEAISMDKAEIMAESLKEELF